MSLEKSHLDELRIDRANAPRGKSRLPFFVGAAFSWTVGYVGMSLAVMSAMTFASS